VKIHSAKVVHTAARFAGSPLDRALHKPVRGLQPSGRELTDYKYAWSRNPRRREGPCPYQQSTALSYWTTVHIGEHPRGELPALADGVSTSSEGEVPVSGARARVKWRHLTRPIGRREELQPLLSHSG